MPGHGPANLLHARAHREVIRRFGRFPYRNAALGRLHRAERAFDGAGRLWRGPARASTKMPPDPVGPDVARHVARCGVSGIGRLASPTFQAGRTWQASKLRHDRHRRRAGRLCRRHPRRPAGLNVAIVEREHMGGICLNWGCIPTKAMLRSAEVFHLMHRAKRIRPEGRRASISISTRWSNARAGWPSSSIPASASDEEEQGHRHHGRGHAARQGQGAVTTDKGTEDLTGRNIVVATGARARELPGLEADGDRVWTYKHALMPPRMPKSCWSSARARSGSNSPASTTRSGPRRPWSRCRTASCRSRMPRFRPSRKILREAGMTIKPGASVKKLDRGKGKVTAHIERAARWKSTTSTR